MSSSSINKQTTMLWCAKCDGECKSLRYCTGRVFSVKKKVNDDEEEVNEYLMKMEMEKAEAEAKAKISVVNSNSRREDKEEDTN